MDNITFAFGINKIINRFDAHTLEFEQIPISRENFKTLKYEPFAAKARFSSAKRPKVTMCFGKVISFLQFQY